MRNDSIALHSKFNRGRCLTHVGREGYGGGLRGRPLVIEFEKGGGMRISFRIEVTRFRRSYMDDTYIGGGLGVTF